ncbi:MAG: transcription initiation factor IIB [Candidatus Thorarchaeota archaeon]|nr:MAG: transcription initiation factor IIB [Candidatus Thorarchaeota archaeon]
MTTTANVRVRKRSLSAVCPNCGNGELVEDRTRGERICVSCGSVLAHGMADTGPEWRAFSREERDLRARTGAPMSLRRADKGLSTVIGWGNKDANGRSLGGKGRTAIYRMRKWQIRSQTHDSKQRNLKLAMSELDRLSSQLGIPNSIRETAAHIYRKALDKRLVRGQSIDGIVAASIYLSCRIHVAPRQLAEIASVAKVDKKGLGMSVRRILRGTGIRVPVPSAITLIPRISSDLGLKGRTVTRAASIIDDARRVGVTDGKAPAGIAGAALYISCILENDRRTQREISNAASVTEVTIRNRYKDLVRKLGIEMDFTQ